MENRGLRFVRYADDCNIFVKSEMSANRVMKSVTSWLERKLFLKVSATKTKVVRPPESKFLGFTYLQRNGVWKCKPSNQSKMKLYDKCRKELVRRIGIARPIAVTFKRINQIVVGWINYYRIGVMKYFVDVFGQWLRHKIRVIILKQWKKPKRIYINLQKLNKKLRCLFTDEQIFSVANTRLGLYRQANGHVVNFLLSPKILAIKKKELENRGLRFVRYADDCNIFVKSEMSANRVMKSVTSWLERKLFLKVSATKTKVVRPPESKFLGFTYLQRNGVWKCKPSNQSKMKLYDKCRKELVRRIGIARPIAVTFKRINQIVVGWINYYRIGVMKYFVDVFGQWLRHKIRVIILKQWKKPKRIYINLQKLNKKLRCLFTDEQIFSVANTRLGLYRQANGHVVNFLLSPKILAIKKKERPGLVNPLNYYLS